MEKDKRRRNRLRKWLKRPFSNPHHHAEDDAEDTEYCSQGDAYDEVFVRSVEMEGCSTARTNELRFQEIVPLKTSNVIGTEDPTAAARWNSLIERTLNNKYDCPDNWLQRYGANIVGGAILEEFNNPGEVSRECNYVILASKKMVGVFISIWVKKEVLRRYQIWSVKVCAVGCGIMGYLGNKGSVAISMCVQGTTFCFIAAHLASGEKRGDEIRRNSQVEDIFRRTLFPRPPQTILGHELYLEDSPARQLIRKNDWKALQEFDQLKKEQNDGVFRGWREGDIEFAPTYKYSNSNSNRYSGGVPNKHWEKQRTPAWCMHGADEGRPTSMAAGAIEFYGSGKM
ncbi:hypothetical protein H6P81_001225 [Aristolochia fimbriata]|uniref:Inositol polyphosphate-related phosphatase domain-containing protein n=1 Tax=Aristolochia fimbriata TaxID=158543 RepID=A0AAV7F9K4_ARIFI|nr:hypothetical protein H6P81_001225 [Aristolochia fimbriata]